MTTTKSLKLLLLLYNVALTVVFLLVLWIPNLYFKLSGIMGNSEFSHFIDFTQQTNKVMLERVEANVGKESIYFIGDSLIQGLNTNSITPNSLNLGVGHNKIEDVRQRLKGYQQLHPKRLLIISVGVNNLINGSIEEALTEYRLLLNDLSLIQNVFVHAVLPIDQSQTTPHLHSKINKFNARLKLLSLQYKNIKFIEIPKQFLANDGGLPSNYHVGDGLHLNAIGNQIWISHLQRTIRDTEK